MRAAAAELEKRPRYIIQSLARGLALLDLVKSGSPPPTLVELSERIGLNLVTTFRLMYTLEHAGYVRRDPDTRRFHVGLVAFELQGPSASLFDYVQAAAPYLEELRGKVGDGVGLGVLEGAHVRNLTRLFSSQIVADSLQPGSLLPAHATSLGKVLLGALPPGQVREQYRNRPLERYTSFTLTSVERLLREVARAQRLGYAVSISECELGVRSVAAPVRDAAGAVVAAITIFTTAPGVTGRALENDYAPLAMMAARATSARLTKLVDHSRPAAV